MYDHSAFRALRVTYTESMRKTGIGTVVFQNNGRLPFTKGFGQVSGLRIILIFFTGNQYAFRYRQTQNRSGWVQICVKRVLPVIHAQYSALYIPRHFLDVEHSADKCQRTNLQIAWSDICRLGKNRISLYGCGINCQESAHRVPCHMDHSRYPPKLRSHFIHIVQCRCDILQLAIYIRFRA